MFLRLLFQRDTISSISTAKAPACSILEQDDSSLIISAIALHTRRHLLPPTAAAWMIR